MWDLAAAGIEVYLLHWQADSLPLSHQGRPHFYFLTFFFWLHHTVFGILVPQPGIEPRPLAVEAWNPNHWATRELPHPFKVYNSMLFSMFTERCNYDPSEFYFHKFVENWTL